MTNFFLSLHYRSAKDAVLERDEESFIAEVQDDVINNLEVEKQSANAYAIWKDEKHPGAFRRGLTKIRQSFRRQRPAAAQKEKPKLEGEHALRESMVEAWLG